MLDDKEKNKKEEEEKENEATELTKRMMSQILQNVESSLRRLQPLVRGGSSLLSKAELGRVFANLVEDQMRHFFLWFNEIMSDICSSSSSSRPSDALALSCLCQEMVSTGITSALSVLIECLPPVSGNEEAESLYGSVVNIPDVIKRTKETSKKLLDFFVSRQSELICKLVRTSLEAPNWLNMKEPREVREVMGHVLRELDVMSKTICFHLGTFGGVFCGTAFSLSLSLRFTQTSFPSLSRHK